MEEIVVDLMWIQSGAQNAYALKEVEVVVEEAAIRVWLLMGIVMISTTIYTAADLMLTLNIVMNVCVKVLWMNI